MITLTGAAVEKVKEVIAQQQSRSDLGLRVGVVAGGCSGFSYHMALDEKATDGDQVFEFDGVKVFVDPNSLIHLKGVEIDFVDSIHGSGFKFNNPNAKSSCGCGESFNA